MNTINGIDFTDRELDVISCLPYMDSSKRIGPFLSVSCKTVDTHLHNIKRKLKYNKRLEIINFVNKNNASSIVKTRYLKLWQQHSFSKELKNIGESKTNIKCLIFFHEVKNKCVSQLESHLKLAGINAITKKWGNEEINSLANALKAKQVDFVLYCLTNDFSKIKRNFDINEKASIIKRLLHKDSKHIIFLSHSEENSIGSTKGFLEYPYFNFTTEKEYYIVFFELLKSLLANLNIDKHITEFNNTLAIISNQNTLLTTKNKQKNKIYFNNKLVNKKTTTLTAVAIILLCIMLVSHNYLLDFNNKTTGINYWNNNFNLKTQLASTKDSNATEAELSETDSRQTSGIDNLINSSYSLNSNAMLKLTSELKKQMENANSLLNHLNFKQGNTRHYKLVKPSWEEIAQVEEEYNALKKQLSTLRLMRLNLTEMKNQGRLKEIQKIFDDLKQSLEVAEQCSSALLSFMNSNYKEAEDKLDAFIANLKTQTLNSELDKKLLLNRAHILKAKIHVQLGRPSEKIIQSLQNAADLLPNDEITIINYGRILFDIGESENDANYYVKSYHYYSKVSLEQVIPSEKPVTYSNMAHAFILLAKNIENKKVDRAKHKLPHPIELRKQAENLLKQSIEMAPKYIYGYLFLSMLSFDAQDYLTTNALADKVLAILPTHATALARKGLALEKLGELNSALDFLEQAKKKLEDYKNCKQNRCWLSNINEKIAQIKNKLRLQQQKEA